MDQKQLTGQNISDGAESKDHIGAGDDGSGSGRESRDAGWVIANIRDFAQFLTGCWMFLMLAVFPLYFGDKYHEIGAYKYSFFSGVSTMILVPAAVLATLVLLWNLGKSRLRVVKGEISALDAGVLLYMAASAVSYLLSDFPSEAWEGVGGWNMGLRTQLLMGTSYFLISRLFPWKKGAQGPGLSWTTGIGGKLIFCGFFSGIRNHFFCWGFCTDSSLIRWECIKGLTAPTIYGFCPRLGRLPGIPAMYVRFLRLGFVSFLPQRAGKSG